MVEPGRPSETWTLDGDGSAHGTVQRGRGHGVKHGGRTVGRRSGSTSLRHRNGSALFLADLDVGRDMPIAASGNFGYARLRAPAASKRKAS